MNFLINASNLRTGGALQVANSFINELINYKNYFFVIVVSDEVNSFLRLSFNQYKYLKVIKYNNRPSVIKSIYGHNKFLSGIEKKYSIDKVFTIFGPSYWRPKSFHICGFAKPDYIFKESPYFNKLNFKEKLILKLKEFFHLIDLKNNADFYITENHSVSERLSKIINKKVETVSNTYNQVFLNNEMWIKSNLKLRKDSFKCLTVTAPYKHKNIEILFDVVNLIKKDFKNLKVDFILTTEAKYYPKLENISNENCRIHFIGKKNMSEIPHLYSISNSMFLPTLLECFSASYCEAMFMKKIILTSNLSFARSSCGDGAIYFDPVNAYSIVSALNKAVNLSNHEKSRLIKKAQNKLKTFSSPKERANKYLQYLIYEN
jgi:glycosyltransferase involved in cell wall biosynthesis